MQNNHSHRILIIADAFGKPAYTPRLRSLCDYLVQQGWLVDVYTERFEPLHFEHAYPITEIPIYRNRSVDWFFKAIGSFFFDLKSRIFAKLMTKQLPETHYDIVFACTFPPTPLRAALQVAKAQQIPLFIDLRDIDEQTPTNQYLAHRRLQIRFVHQCYRRINIRRRNAIITQAYGLSSVSPWHVAFLRQWNTNVHLIYNGFDKSLFVPKDECSDTFRITYTGRIYDAALQNPSLFFEALGQLCTASLLPDQLQVDWYTDDIGKARVMNWARKSGTAERMLFHSYVPTTKIPHLLHQSSIILVASQKSSANGTHGIMTTKFFEALGVEKPVLCVPSDEDCLAQVIKETNAGLAATSTEQIKTFILEKYAEWKQNGYTRQKVNKEIKQQFTRQYQAKQFEQIFLKAIHGNE